MDEDDFALGDLAFAQQDSVTLFEDRAEMNVVTLGLADEGFTVRLIDCTSDAAMLAGLDAALHWRAQFGRPLTRLNLDALTDALRGVPSDEESRVLLVLEGFREFEARDPRRAAGMIEAIRDAAADHLEVGRRLLAFICAEEPEDGPEGAGEDEDDAAARWLNG